jgi:hypothetical protein
MADTIKPVVEEKIEYLDQFVGTPQQIRAAKAKWISAHSYREYEQIVINSQRGFVRPRKENKVNE